MLISSVGQRYRYHDLFFGFFYIGIELNVIDIKRYR